VKKFVFVISLLVLASMLLSACGAPAPEPTKAPVVEAPAATEVPATEVPAPTEPPVPAWEAPQGALVAVPVDAAPTLDGVADDAAWANAEAIEIEVDGGFDDFATKAELKAVYTADTAYFVLTYADPTESWYRYPWVKQEDGSWKQDKDPNDKGGDNNLHYEDKFAMIWNINNSIAGFNEKGCAVTCHAGENSDLKPYGNKYTKSEGELGDIWHWKSVRMLNQIDDQYVDSMRLDASTPELQKSTIEAGRHGDKKDSGGYSDNYASAEDHSMPGFTSPSVDLTTGAPGFILDSEKVAIDKAALDAMPAGSIIPGIVKSQMVGDRGDISASWKWADGVWTIEFSRALETGSETDVQFNDLTAQYFFGLAVFENAQVRHAYEFGASSLVFMPK